MVKRLMAVMLMVALIAAVVSVGGIAEADEPTPPGNVPEDDLAHARQFTYDNGSYGGKVDGNGDGLLFTASEPSVPGAGSASGMYQNIKPNPWGCRIRAEDPHESHRKPGPGHIQAKATINCTIAPPPYTAIVTQDLSRVKGSSIVIEKVKTSSCPSGTGEPECYPNLNKRALMRAYINITCEVGATYRWVHLADARMYVNGVLYSGLSGKARNEKCEG